MAFFWKMLVHLDSTICTPLQIASDAFESVPTICPASLYIIPYEWFSNWNLRFAKSQ